MAETTPGSPVVVSEEEQKPKAETAQDEVVSDIPIKDRSPFVVNKVNTDIKENVVPKEPSGNLEVEENYSRNEEINQLIREVRTREWRENQRQSRFFERLGRNQDLMGGVRRFLGGENDYTIVTENGRTFARRNIGIEIGRKALNIGWKTVKTGGIMLGVGLLTGGAGSIAYGAVLGGSALARAAVETARYFSQESVQREELTVAREAYADKVEQIADRIGRINPPNADQMSQEEISEYHRINNQAIKDLVNLVHNSDQAGVVIKRDEQGRVYFAGGPVGGSIPPGVEPGEPPPGGPSGPSIHTGTEVYQQSELAPGAKTLDSMEEGLEKSRKRWEKIEEIAAFAGGVAGGIASFLHGQASVVSKAVEKLSNGDVVQMDINGDGIRHGVQKVSEAMANKYHIASQYIWYHKNPLELVAAQAAKNPIFHMGQYGARLLNEKLFGALVSQYRGQQLETVIPIIAGLLGRLAYRWKTNENQSKHFDIERSNLKQDQEILRRRLQPESRTAQLIREATESGKPYPEPGQEWVYENENGWHRIEILETNQPKKDQFFAKVRRFDPEGGDNVIETIRLEDLIFGNSKCLERKDKEGATETPYESTGGNGEKHTEKIDQKNPITKKESNTDVVPEGVFADENKQAKMPEDKAEEEKEGIDPYCEWKAINGYGRGSLHVFMIGNKNSTELALDDSEQYAVEGAFRYLDNPNLYVLLRVGEEKHQQYYSVLFDELANNLRPAQIGQEQERNWQNLIKQVRTEMYGGAKIFNSQEELFAEVHGEEKVAEIKPEAEYSDQQIEKSFAHGAEWVLNDEPDENDNNVYAHIPSNEKERISVESRIGGKDTVYKIIKIIGEIPEHPDEIRVLFTHGDRVSTLEFRATDFIEVMKPKEVSGMADETKQDIKKRYVEWVKNKLTRTENPTIVVPPKPEPEEIPAEKPPELAETAKKETRKLESPEPAKIIPFHNSGFHDSGFFDNLYNIPTDEVVKAIGLNGVDIENEKHLIALKNYRDAVTKFWSSKQTNEDAEVLLRAQDEVFKKGITFDEKSLVFPDFIKAIEIMKVLIRFFAK